jgi:ribosome biogenesis GTPase
MDKRRGQISKSTGSWYHVRFEEGDYLDCRLRGKFKNLDLKVTNPLAVGDWVQVEVPPGEPGFIVEIEPRRNYIIRKSVKKTDHAHLLAANIDRAALVVTLAMPRTSVGFIDRFLVSAEAFRIPAILIFNKLDLLNQAGKDFQRDLMDLYASLGYTCFEISAAQSIGMEPLAAHLSEGTTVLSGHSGAGKSTIINHLLPDVQQRTQKVSSYANKGVHTTTFAEMFPFGEDAFIIDTPGIKELGLVDMENWEISHYFPEMRAYLGECRFNNCIHLNEPGCAVIAAMERGEIADSRYLSYFSMISNEESHR